MLQNVSIDLIDEGKRLRAIDPMQVTLLAESIAEVGLLSPITLYRCKVVRGHIAVDGFELIAGLHRFHAFKTLGLAEIPAHVVELDSLHRQLAECDENLCGAKLSSAERSLFTRTRKRVYLALHPETKHGGEREKGASRKLCDLTSDKRFTADTAAKTGKSERSVQLDVERGEKVSEQALETVRGTDLDRGTYLDKLKKLPSEEQIKTVETDLAARRRKPTRNQSTTKDRQPDPDPIEAARAQFWVAFRRFRSLVDQMDAAATLIQMSAEIHEPAVAA